jgi:hypothetical protein
MPWRYVEVRMEQVESFGGNPNSDWVSIALQLVGGNLLAWGRYVHTGVPIWAMPI